MTTQDFGELQVRALRRRLQAEFPKHDVWVGASNYYDQIEYRVGDHTGGCYTQSFPGAIEKIVDLVQAALG